MLLDESDEEEDERGVHAAAGRAGGALGGGGADPVHIRQAQPGPGIRSGGPLTCCRVTA